MGKMREQWVDMKIERRETTEEERDREIEGQIDKESVSMRERMKYSVINRELVVKESVREIQGEWMGMRKWELRSD